MRSPLIATLLLCSAASIHASPPPAPVESEAAVEVRKHVAALLGHLDEVPARPEISFEAASAIAGVVWVDVRSTVLFDEAHHEGAIHLLPSKLAEFMMEASRRNVRERTFIVYCTPTCDFSQWMARALGALGLDARPLAGGWQPAK